MRKTKLTKLQRCPMHFQPAGFCQYCQKEGSSLGSLPQGLTGQYFDYLILTLIKLKNNSK